MPVDNNGIACGFKILREINPDAKFVEDASQALGSYSEGKPLGSFGDISCFSMATTKIVTMGQGGVCVTDDLDLYRSMVAMKDQGRVAKGDEYPLEGYNFKVTEMQSALGCSQLNKLPERIKHMRHICKIYSDELEMDNPTEELLWRAYAFVPPKRREGIIAKMLNLGVRVQPFSKPVTTMIKSETTVLPASYEFSAKGIYLPSSSTLSDEDIKYVCDSLKKAVKVIR
jgi:perosamine synthetase